MARLLKEKSPLSFRHHRGGHYTVHSSDPDKDLKAMAGNLDVIRRGLGEALGVDLKGKGRHFQVIHLRGTEEYRDLCEALKLERYALEATGCFAPGLPGRPVIIQGLDIHTRFHELAHQFARAEMGPGLADVAWVGEGLGALFEAFPVLDFTKRGRYPKGREKILARGFSLEAFSKRRDRSEEVYDVGATIHRAFLFGPDRETYLLWLKDLARRKCTPADLPRYTSRDWGQLRGRLRAYCRRHEPVKPR